MKSIQRSFVFTLVPLLITMSATAETGTQSTPGHASDDAHAGATAYRVSEVMGYDVKNSSGDSVGDVKDIVLDMKSGDVLAVIISSGGFLGIGATLSAVPMSAVSHDRTNKTFTTRLTKDQLGKAPQFKNDEWPEHNDSDFAASLRSFRDSIGGDVTSPDNTAQNEKDTNKEELTASDQSNDSNDVRITRDIRSGIMGTEMSFNAKNIKIITRNARVTLKGVVESDEEHKAVLRIAESHASKANITDELDVKSE